MARKIEKKRAENDLHLPLGKENYKLMVIGFVIIVIGFLLMIGTEDIYSFRKITLSVIIIMIGYLFEIYAIMKKPKAQERDVE